jgi:hypothetical protein
MSRRTDKYQLAFYEQDDLTDAATEMQRWETLDVQLYALFDVLGNGIKTGWDLVVSDGLNITISPGSGHVSFVAVESDNSVTIENLLQGTTQYIYAEITEDSYWNQTVVFSAYITLLDDTDTSLYLGSVTTDDVSVVTATTTGRSVLGFQSLIDQSVNEHRHIGGVDNPDPIDLASEVQGVLNQQNVPDLDASKISTGILDPDRIPDIDHETGITNNGTLTHSQLDAFVETLDLPDSKKMGEVSTTNLLQLILALKHQYPNIDDYLVNEIAFIPGISPDDYVDTVNTTATVDYRTFAEGGTHTIAMTPSSGLTAYTRIWDTEDDFTDSTNSNVFIDGDSVCLSTTNNSKLLDNLSNLEEWTVTTEDLSDSSSLGIELDGDDFVESATSGKITVTNKETEMSLSIKKDFDTQDWSSYDFLTFYIKTEDVEHGDWVFYFSDAVSGIQNSNKLVLERNAPTIDVDTLENGWQEVRFDLRPYARASVNQMALFTSTQLGWDNSKPFSLNIDKFSLSTGSFYEDDGYIRVVYGNDVLVDFWKLRWNVSIPTDSASSGLVFKARTRNSNTVLGLSSAEWSDYFTVSGTELDIPDGTLYKYIEIEVYFETSTLKTRTACLKKLYIDYYVNDDDTQFEFESQDDWETGKLFNIDTTSESGSIQVSNLSDIGTYCYATDGSVGKLDSELNTTLSISGSSLPLTTNQALNGLSPSFGYLSSVMRGDNGSLWISDIDNDRVVNVDKFGNLLTGLYGSFLNPPEDKYGTEDSGPGSNTNISTTTTTNEDAIEMDVLHSLYNESEGVLYVVFNNKLINVYDASNPVDMDKLYIKVGAHRFNLSDSNIEILGVPEDKFSIWGDLSTVETDATKFANQFTFDSHVLKITLSGAEKTAISETLVSGDPSISVGQPYQNYKTSDNFVKVSFALSNVTLGNNSGQYGIKLSINGAASFIIYDHTYTFSALEEDDYVVTINLVDSDDVELTNDEAFTTLQFSRWVSYSNPYIGIQQPRPNQIYSNNPVVVDFTVNNFPVIPTGQHVKYQVDSEPAVDYYSTDPITLLDVTSGKHTLRIYTVDINGDKLTYDHGDVTSDFIVGLNLNAIPKLYVDEGATKSKDEKSVISSRNNIDVANVFFRNIYSPIDLQVIPNDPSGLAGDDLSILISKLRSPSWLNGLSGQANSDEVKLRAENITRTASGDDLLTPDSSLEDIPTEELIYGSYYLDGHSVTQTGITGEAIFTNNAAKFADDKANSKDILGSAEKIGGSELLIGDSVRQRAIIVHTDLDTKVPEIAWQYDSDKFVPDFHLVYQDQKVITINDDSVSEDSVFVRQGTTIVWENNSSSPVTVYSGSTTLALFNQDPDLTLYGSEFTSPVLAPGENYSFEFVSNGEFDWFVYPDILTGKITVTKQRLSSRDLYYILESDGLESPFTSRLIKVDSWGNILWSFGEAMLIKPRDVRPMINGNILLST